MKFEYNSTGNQMVEQRSSWENPDTINLSSLGKTDHGSILIQEYEAHSYSHRLIQSLIDYEKIQRSC